MRKSCGRILFTSTLIANYMAVKKVAKKAPAKKVAKKVAKKAPAKKVAKKAAKKSPARKK